MIDRTILLQRLERAYELLLKRGVIHSKSDLARAINKEPKNLMAAFSNTGRAMTLGLLTRVADTFPDVLNRDYLLKGEGDVAAPDKSLKPHYPATVAAGVLSGDVAQVMDYEVDMELPIRRFGKYDYMIDVEGSSMEPTYYSGDTVACRELIDSRELKPGKIYVFVTRDGAVLKRYVSQTLSSIRVASDNLKFNPYGIDKDSILSIAEVVGSLCGPRDNDPKGYMRLLEGIYATKHPKSNPCVDHQLDNIESKMNFIQHYFENIPEKSSADDNT